MQMPRFHARSLVIALLVGVMGFATAAHGLTPKARARAISVGVQSALKARSAGQFKAAFNTLGALATQFPKSARVRHELGVLYAIHGQLNLAAAQLSEALRLDRTLTAARRGLAEVLRAANRCGDALPQYVALLRTSTQRPVALRGLALCREATGDETGSRAALAQLARDHGQSGPGRWATDYLRVLASTPKGTISAASAEREGLLHFRAKRYAEAGTWFELACHRGPSADRCFRLGVARLGERDFLAAAMAFRRALSLNPKHMPTLSAWPTAARKLRQQGRGGVASDFSSTAGSRPALRVARALLSDDLLLAEQLANAAIRKGHKGRALLLLRAETRLRAGQISRAGADLRALLRMRPDLVIARHAMATLYMRRNQPALARRYAGLPEVAVPPPGSTWPAGVNANADLASFARWRRAAMDHRLRRMNDPGLKPFPRFVPPPPLNPESIRVAAPPTPPRARKARRKRRRR